jgi:hypothetical protein
MKAALLWTSFYVVLFSGFTFAGVNEALDPKCQQYAHDFAENPDALNETQLKQLQFCITQTLEQRYKTDPPELLKGTIIDSLPPSLEDSDTKIPVPSQDPGVKNKK